VIFTGVGAVGAVGIGMLAAGDPAGPARLVAIGFVVAGVVMLRAAET
jgi:quaternary ammonium compound-resistance protein SugE